MKNENEIATTDTTTLGAKAAFKAKMAAGKAKKAAERKAAAEAPKRALEGLAIAGKMMARRAHIEAALEKEAASAATFFAATAQEIDFTPAELSKLAAKATRKAAKTDDDTDAVREAEDAEAEYLEWLEREAEQAFEEWLEEGDKADQAVPERWER